ncbi:MAG: rod shape-determining protein MreC [Oscillospiraceae bacterium]|nr:rod shape-determining protein MreC [Oscillospiraceae bacterium]
MKFLWEHKWIMLLVAALMAALAFTVSAMLNPGYAAGPSGLLDGVLRPAQYAAGVLRDKMSSLWGDRELIDSLLDENRRLKQYIAEIDEQARNYERTEAEIKRLREMLGFQERRRDFEFIPATVIARDMDNYARTMTLSRGSRHGVEPGMAVVSESEQLIGVVSEVSAFSSTLRTVLDPGFVCGAYIYRAALDGLCTGRFSYMRENLTTVEGFTPDMDIRIGDAVLTSGSDAGSQYPRDLSIGAVSAVLADPNGMTATVLVEPLADLRHIEQVFIIMSFDVDG